MSTHEKQVKGIGKETKMAEFKGRVNFPFMGLRGVRGETGRRVDG